MSGINGVNGGMSQVAAGASGGTSQVAAGASGRMPMGRKMADLFNQMDTNKTGSITKAQFDSSFQKLNLPAGLKAQGANAIFAKLDPHGTGTVSKQAFVAGMRSISAKRGHEVTKPSVAPAATLASGLNALNGALGNNENQQGPQQPATNLSIYA